MHSHATSRSKYIYVCDVHVSHCDVYVSLCDVHVSLCDVHMSQVEAMIAQVDEEGDGVLLFSEFASLMRTALLSDEATRSRRDRDEIAPRSRRDRDEIATRSRRDRDEIAPRSRRDRAEIAPRSRGDRDETVQHVTTTTIGATTTCAGAPARARGRHACSCALDGRDAQRGERDRIAALLAGCLRAPRVRRLDSRYYRFYRFFRF